MKILQYVVYTNKGNIRIDNEDSYLVKEKPYPLFAVADGMGGHQAGEIASQMAVKCLDSTDFDYQDILSNIKMAINKANLEIYKKGKSGIMYKEMGTTLSMGILFNMELFIGHVGDSRIYIFRNKELKQLTRDHSLVNELLENKQITCQEAFDHPQKNIITQALGTSSELKIETKKIKVYNNDILLFSTDGLHDMLRYNEIKDLFFSNNNIENISSLLGKRALELGGKDNITFIIVKID